MGELDLSMLPGVNAVLNALATVLLVAGFLFIRRRRERAHRRCMLGALALSALFLAGYVLHKVWRAQAGGELHTRFEGEGIAQGVYLLILFTHLVLAMTVPVFAGLLVWMGLTGRRAAHRRLARWGFPVWLYVSVTGVLIYLMLYPFNPAGP